MLKDLKVVELATHIATPGAAGILAQWGADVIKVEGPTGDPYRHDFADLTPSGTNPAFEMDNRGKRSIALDIGEAGDKAVLLELIRHCDVFLTSVRPRALERAGLTWEALSADNPRLIFASVSGYGSQGPDSDLPGYDVAAFWSRSGMAALTTPKGYELFPIRTGVGDHSCSLATALGIMAALYDRERTGRGRRLETSLLRTATYALGSDLSIFLRLGRIASTLPRRETRVPIVNFFTSADGKAFCLMPRNMRADWPKMAEAAGAPEFAEDDRYASAASRREHAGDLVAALDAAFARFEMDELAARFRALDLVWAPVNRPPDLVEDAQAIAAGCFDQGIDVTDEAFRTIAPPISWGEEPGPLQVPELDEHGEAIRTGLGARNGWPKLRKTL